MLKNKSGALPIIKILIVIITVAIIFIGWVITLQIGITTDEKKINTQISINKLLDGNCFSNSYGTIKSSEFTEENLAKCFPKTQNKQLRVKIDKKTNFYYSASEEEFGEMANKCSTSSSILCTEMHYPIIFEENENNRKLSKLVVQIITT